MTLRGDRGLTLLELAVVMAVFSLVAVIALQALGGAMIARDRVSAQAEETADLAAATALLRRDLQSMVPLPTEEGGMAFTTDDTRIDFVAAGQPQFPSGDREGIARITWAMSDGRLIRSSRAWEEDGSEEAVVLMEGLTAWEVRSLDPRGDWQGNAPDDPSLARMLPRAVEVRFATESLGDIRVLVAR